MRKPSLPRFGVCAAPIAASPFRIDRAKMGAGTYPESRKRLALRGSGRYYVIKALARREMPADIAERVIPIMTAFSTGFRPICSVRI